MAERVVNEAERKYHSSNKVVSSSLPAEMRFFDSEPKNRFLGTPQSRDSLTIENLKFCFNLELETSFTFEESIYG